MAMHCEKIAEVRIRLGAKACLLLCEPFRYNLLSCGRAAVYALIELIGRGCIVRSGAEHSGVTINYGVSGDEARYEVNSTRLCMQLSSRI